MASVVAAFAILYIVWGSTYLGIKYALVGFPTFALGGIRFAIAGGMMLMWCVFRREKVWQPKLIAKASFTGLMLLLMGNGGVVFAENYLPSALVAIIISSAPIWFVLLDRPMWRSNFTNPYTMLGLLAGFVGVAILFYGSLSDMQIKAETHLVVISFLAVLIGCICWAGGSIFSKYKSEGTPWVNSAWQMLAAAVAFGLISMGSGEAWKIAWSDIPASAWIALWYLIVFGSLAGFTSYVWLLSVRPATQVSTYAYVNPVVAVILGYWLDSEPISGFQILGLAIVLLSILMINLDKYLKRKL